MPKDFFCNAVKSADQNLTFLYNKTRELSYSQRDI